jgi:hypothetical protein
MKTISIKSPWAQLICYGVKDVENRTWTTAYRGPLLIHTSTDDPGASLQTVPLLADSLHIRKGDFSRCKYLLPGYKLRPDAPPEMEPQMRLLCAIAERREVFLSNAIIGSVQLVDIVRDSPSRWAEKNCWHWILRDPVLFDRAITHVRGSLGLWDYNRKEVMTNG